MSLTRLARIALLLLSFVLFITAAAIGQTETASISGLVTDSSGAVIVGAEVQIQSVERGTITSTKTNNAGIYLFASVQPGQYHLTVRQTGFRQVDLPALLVNVQAHIEQNFRLQVGSVSESVTVEGTAPLVNTQNAAVSTVVDRRFVANLPLNGRTFQSLLTLVPGVVLSPEAGQLSVNGQRSNANYFTVDGVSANIGMSRDTSPGKQTGGSIPGFDAQGGTNGLVTIDALEEFAIQTSTPSAQFGRQPGGQVQLATRSGTNVFHGSLFEYFRNEALDANDWFRNNLQLAKPALRQNQFGITVGGPIIPNRTFFFFSYEGARLRLPTVAVNRKVPSLSLRQEAPSAIQPLLNAFPLPTGPENLSTRTATLSTSYSNPSTQNATSIRVDHVFGPKLTVFGRYNRAPSEKQSRSLSNLSQLTTAHYDIRTLTIGANLNLTSTITNELRTNYSRSTAAQLYRLDNFGGATPPPDSLVFPPPFASPEASTFFFNSMAGRFQVGRLTDNIQRQINLVDNLSVSSGRHSWKFGIDYRRLFPYYGPFDYSLNVMFSTPADLLAATANYVAINSGTSNTIFFDNVAVYAQDTWKIGSRLTLDYGLRWELNPPPHGKKPLYTVTGVDNPAALALASPGTPVYRTRYNGFGPRIGAAYQLRTTKARELVLRGGFGIISDLGSGTVGDAVSSFPGILEVDLSDKPFPLDSASLQPPPPFSLTPPIVGASVVAFDRGYVLPRIYEWNLALEQALGSSQAFTATYVGAAGRRLLRKENLFFENPSPAFTKIRIGYTNNLGSSDYNALELQFQHRLSRGLQAIASYTWSHSIDNASNDFFLNAPANLLSPATNRGSSDFDLRHALRGAVSYDIPAPGVNRVFRAALGDWGIDAIIKAESGSPVNVTVGRDLGFNFSYYNGEFRPDLVPGQPIYLKDPNVAGGRRINPAAFFASPEVRQGTLPRNAVRGFPLSQIDFSLRRQFHVTERVGLQFRGDLFNILNHPNFATPEGYLGEIYGTDFYPYSGFGQSYAMLNGSLGALNPLFQIGGPRSVQLSLKLFF